MKWPFVLRAVHEAEVGALARELAESRRQESYWRARSELFIDRAAAKAGITHEPVMRHAGVEDIPVDPFAANPFAGIGVSVFDSTKADGRAS